MIGDLPPALILPAKELIRPAAPYIIRARDLPARLAMPLPGMPVMVPSTGKKATVVAVIDDIFVSSATNAGDYTFSNVGLTGSWSHIIVGAGSQGGTTVTSLTVEGNAATIGQQSSNGLQYSSVSAIASSTATPDIFVDWSGTCGNCGVGVVAITGLLSTTPADTATSNANPAALDVDTTPGGIVFAMTFNAATGDVTWTGATEFAEQTIESPYRMSCAYDLTPSAETPRDVGAGYASFNVGTAAACAYR